MSSSSGSSTTTFFQPILRKGSELGTLLQRLCRAADRLTFPTALISRQVDGQSGKQIMDDDRLVLVLPRFRFVCLAVSAVYLCFTHAVTFLPSLDCSFPSFSLTLLRSGALSHERKARRYRNAPIWFALGQAFWLLICSVNSHFELKAKFFDVASEQLKVR